MTIDLTRDEIWFLKALRAAGERGRIVSTLASNAGLARLEGRRWLRDKVRSRLYGKRGAQSVTLQGLNDAKHWRDRAAEMRVLSAEMTRGARSAGTKPDTESPLAALKNSTKAPAT